MRIGSCGVKVAMRCASSSSSSHSHGHKVLKVKVPKTPDIKIRATKAFIDGQWISTGKTFQTYNPANEEKLADVTLCGKAEVDAAVDAATEAFYRGEWSKLGGYQRSQLMNKLADLIEKNIDELAMLECLDNGKPFSVAKFGDISLVVQTYRYYAGWADKIHGTVLDPSGPFAPPHSTFSYVAKEPVGVVGQIIPWNFPALMQAWKLGPALAAGCTVVLKPAPQTPLTALRIAELAQEAGFPKGVINIVPGDDETGKLVTRHPKFDKLAFTGSTAVGKEIMKTAAIDLKRVTLELGGKSPMIVLDDADVDKVVQFAKLGVFFNQGQVCCATSRVFVNNKTHDHFLEKMSKEAKAINIGAGWDPDTHHGPQVSREQFETVHSFIKHGIEEGATLVAGGPEIAETGFFIQPTIFGDVKDDMKIAKEEIFGPVMSVLKFHDDDEVIARANDSPYGLAASVFSTNFSRAHKFARGLRAGTVWVNTYGTFDAAIPFGGFKQSGIGRELGESGLEPYLERKSVVHNLL